MKNNNKKKEMQKQALEDYLRKESGSAVRLDYVAVIDGIIFSQGSSEKKAREKALSLGLDVPYAFYKYADAVVKKEDIDSLAIGYDLKAKRLLGYDEFYQRLSGNYLS